MGTKHFSNEKKKEIVEYAKEHTNIAAAKKYGVSQSAIGNWRNGKVQKPRAKKSDYQKIEIAPKEPSKKIYLFCSDDPNQLIDIIKSMS